MSFSNKDDDDDDDDEDTGVNTIQAFTMPECASNCITNHTVN
jgi:hypothetical protein